jgi:magnesium-protoporphyrin O-methyltransferase
VSCGGHCCAIDENFDRRVAEAELDRYRRKGPSPTTRQLLNAIGEAGAAGTTVLDVGGGVGALAFELIDAGASHATVVDASAAFLAAARDEVERRRAADRLELVHGDFVSIAPEMPVADVVTLDKVVCCYPDMEPLLDASATRARRLYGIVYPRDSWWVKFGVAAQNVARRVRGKSFRVHVYPNAAIEDAIRRSGHSILRRERGFVWVVDLYERTVPLP